MNGDGAKEDSENACLQRVRKPVARVWQMSVSVSGKQSETGTGRAQRTHVNHTARWTRTRDQLRELIATFTKGISPAKRMLSHQYARVTASKCYELPQLARLCWL